MKKQKLQRLKITIPDGTPEFQIKMLKQWIEIAKSMETLTGQEGTSDFSQFYAEIERLEKLLNQPKQT